MFLCRATSFSPAAEYQFYFEPLTDFSLSLNKFRSSTTVVINTLQASRPMEPRLEEPEGTGAELVGATSECSSVHTAPSYNATNTTTTTASVEDDETMSRFVMDKEHGDTQLPAIISKKTKKGRRKIVSKNLDLQSLQELDDAVASVASGICHSPHRRDDDDAISASSHTLTSAYDSFPAAYRKVIDSIPRTELSARNRNLYLYGRGSMSVASSSRSRRSSASRRRSRRKRGDSLERLISETILETSVNWNKDRSGAGAGDSLESSKTAVSTDEILFDLVQAGVILEHEVSSCLSASSCGEEDTKQIIPVNNLLPTVMSDGGESGDLDIDIQPPRPQGSNTVLSHPLFFKLNSGHNPSTRRSIGTTASASATHTYTSSEDPFKLLDEQDAYSSVLWSTSEENGSRSTSLIKELEQKPSERSECESSNCSKKDIKPSVTDDGFPIDAATLINQPVESFFGSDWATFDSNDVFNSIAEHKETESNASPSSIADFDQKSRRSMRSVETSQALVATKLSI